MSKYNQSDRSEPLSKVYGDIAQMLSRASPDRGMPEKFSKPNIK